MKGELKQLQQQLQIQFHDSVLLKQAFTHASYVNEHRFNQHQDNERLEFLGDAVLELTVSEYLYNLLPDRPEGELTKLRAAIVCEPSLVKFAESLGFGRYVLLGKGKNLRADVLARPCWLMYSNPSWERFISTKDWKQCGVFLIITYFLSWRRMGNCKCR